MEKKPMAPELREKLDRLHRIAGVALLIVSLLYGGWLILKFRPETFTPAEQPPDLLHVLEGRAADRLKIIPWHLHRRHRPEKKAFLYDTPGHGTAPGPGIEPGTWSIRPLAGGGVRVTIDVTTNWLHAPNRHRGRYRLRNGHLQAEWYDADMGLPLTVMAMITGFLFYGVPILIVSLIADALLRFRHHRRRRDGTRFRG